MPPTTYLPAPEPDEEPASLAAPPESDDLDASAIERLTRMALYAREGEAFTFGVRTLRREFVSIDTEQAITNRVLELAGAHPGETLSEVFAVAQAELTPMAAWILADYDAPEGVVPDDEAALAWIRNKRNKVTTKQVIALVLGQVELHDQVALLGKALSASVQLELLAAAFNLPIHPRTSSGTP